MTIGKAAKLAGVSVQTIRYYEQRGLLPSHARRDSGYRELTEDTVRVIRFVKRAQHLGFSLDEIDQLVRLRNDQARERPRVRGLAEVRLQQIDEKIRELTALRRALSQLVRACATGSKAECPIIEALECTTRSAR